MTGSTGTPTRENFAPFAETLMADRGFRSVDPTIDWRNTISWRLTDGLSIDYIVDLLRLPRVRAENQVSQSVLLRFSFGS